MGEANPGEGVAGVPGAVPCPELPFHISFGSSLTSRLISLLTHVWKPIGTMGDMLPATVTSGVHCALLEGTGGKEEAQALLISGLETSLLALDW